MLNKPNNPFERFSVNWSRFDSTVNFYCTSPGITRKRICDDIDRQTRITCDWFNRGDSLRRFAQCEIDALEAILASNPDLS